MELEQYKKQVGGQLRMERRLRELSQREVGELMGVHARTIMFSEQGSTTLDVQYQVAVQGLGLDWSKVTSAALEVGDE